MQSTQSNNPQARSSESDHPTRPRPNLHSHHCAYHQPHHPFCQYGFSEPEPIEAQEPCDGPHHPLPFGHRHYEPGHHWHHPGEYPPHFPHHHHLPPPFPPFEGMGLEVSGGGPMPTFPFPPQGHHGPMRGGPAGIGLFGREIPHCGPGMYFGRRGGRGGPFGRGRGAYPMHCGGGGNRPFASEGESSAELRMTNE
ncbi:hypothetical protein B0J17DRAFT_720960 [Rhizoctonia solani]|nr:hypothetical protein B0J17DRAFT_720960 [Rhizoctonia solani]